MAGLSWDCAWALLVVGWGRSCGMKKWLGKDLEGVGLLLLLLVW